MNYNIIKIYLDFLEKSFLEYFKIILKNKYSKEMCLDFINRYISVRYYNETNYYQVKDIVDRINRELVDLVKSLANRDNVDDLKNIVALFGYLLYFDDVCFAVHDMEIINSIVNDQVVKIDDIDEVKKALKEWYINFKTKKESFYKTLNTKDFNVIEKRVYRKVYYLELEHDIKISNLYSEYAINKAYNSSIINEDKAFIKYILASSIILENATNLDFSKHYIVDLPETLFTKEKKLNRLFNALNNTLAKKFIFIKITYHDYINNKDVVNKFINDGYFFVLELDSSYSDEITELFLFPFIMVREDSEEYDLIMKEKDRLKSKIIKL